MGRHVIAGALKLVTAVAAASGCDQVFGVEPPIDAAVRTACLRDDFTGTELGPLWAVIASQHPWISVGQRDTLELAFAAGTPFDSVNGLGVQTLLDLRGGSMQAELVEPPPVNTHMVLTLSQTREHENYLIDVVTGSAGTLIAFYSRMELVGEPIVHDRAKHRYARIRHDVMSGNVLFELSGDGTAWPIVRTSPASVPFDVLAFGIIAAPTGWGPVAAGTGRWDKLDIKPSGCMPAAP